MNLRYLCLGICLLISWACPVEIAAQRMLGSHFVQQGWAAYQTRPAYHSPNIISVGLLRGYGSATHSGFSYEEVLIPKPESDSFYLDLDGAIEQMGAQNALGTDARMDWLTVGISPHSMLGLYVGVSTRQQNYLTYPKALVGMLWQGNSQWLGDRFAIAPDFRSLMYHEVAAGLSIKTLSEVSFGFRAKYLNGLSNFESTYSELLVSTDPQTYEIGFEADYAVRSSMIRFNSADTSFGYTFAPFTSNHGFAMDFGIEAQLPNDVSISAGFLDLGFINWKQDARYYHVHGSMNFKGLTVSELINQDSATVMEIVDSLISQIEFDEGTAVYTTYTQGQLYASMNRKINDFFTAGGLVHIFRRGPQVSPAFALNGTFHLKDRLNVGLTYSIHDRRYDHVGLSLLVMAGPVRMFVMSDDVISWLAPYQAQSANFQFGLEFGFGEVPD
ncbi:DUF5723 family protein [Pontibacter sp. G13]|uniref:DUF5723 family protein n=1 Tax=Pontibacter sp. G13 TaxID=3074898 RepID=UPI002889250A|nr:DUF5723 family protein [Pontibacter sp. G13]WNJ16854.1 DUF5723 family protein [Pontibacter sp. G13]